MLCKRILVKEIVPLFAEGAEAKGKGKGSIDEPRLQRLQQFFALRLIGKAQKGTVLPADVPVAVDGQKFGTAVPFERGELDIIGIMRRKKVVERFQIRLFHAPIVTRNGQKSKAFCAANFPTFPLFSSPFAENLREIFS